MSSVSSGGAATPAHSALDAAPAHAQSEPGATFAYTFVSQIGTPRASEPVEAKGKPAQAAAEWGKDLSTQAAPAATSVMPLRRLEVSLDDPLLGSVAVRAEVREGALHASIRGGSEVASSMAELHQFLVRNDVAVHSLTMQHVASAQQRSADVPAPARAAENGGTHEGNGDAQRRQPERQPRPAWKAGEGQEETGSLPQVDMAGAATSGLQQGSTLSIHI